MEYLIGRLLDEEPRWRAARAAGELAVPADPDARFQMYRSLVNVRPPRPVDEEYLQVEDAFLQGELRARGVVELGEVRAASPVGAGSGILLWQGDITRLAVDGIVNAANSALLGCYVPCHGCIDNAIHTAAGVRLRLTCDEIMRAQGAPEPTGRAKITPGFNLPAAHVLHTVGPIVQGDAPTAQDRAALAACYRACLDLAAAQGLTSVAFCCLSTGEFRFPKREAAAIAVETVTDWLKRAESVGRQGKAGREGREGRAGREGREGRESCAGRAGRAGRAGQAGRVQQESPAAPAPAAPAAAPAAPAVPVVVLDVFGDENYAIYQEILEERNA